jgi:hypothetical protein
MGYHHHHLLLPTLAWKIQALQNFVAALVLHLMLCITPSFFTFPSHLVLGEELKS